MYQSTDKDIWRVFREHHYLTQDFNKGAKVFLLYWGDTLIGINSILNLPNAAFKYGFRTHRLVILPDYQNLGCGTKFEEFIGEWLLKQSCKLFLRTSHLRLGLHCQESELWKANSTNRKIRKDKDTITASQAKRFKNTDFKRCAYSFEYVGKDYYSKEHQNIVCMGDCDKSKARELLESIVDNNKFVSIVTGVAKQSAETNTIWEEIAKEYSYRIEILHLNTGLNGTFVKNNFDLICTSKEDYESILPLWNNVNKYILYGKEKDKTVKNF